MTEIYSYIKLLDGVVEVISELHKNHIKLSIVTSDSIPNTTSILKYLGIDFAFDVVIGKENTKEPKITGAPARLAVEMMKLKNFETVCVGDTPIDIIMAKKSNLRAGIGVATGQIGYDELIKYSPYIVSSMNDIRVS